MPTSIALGPTEPFTASALPNDTPEVFTRPYRQEAFQTVPAHRHADRSQLACTTRGYVIFMTRHGFFFVPRGRALWLPVGTDHACTAGRDGADSRIVNITPGLGQELGDKPFVIPVSALLAATTESLQLSEHGPERCAALQLITLDEVARAPIMKLALAGPEHSGLQRVVQTCGLNGDAIGLDKAARMAGMSRRSFCRRFTAETGLSYGQWMKRRRMMTGAALLQSGTTVTAAALETGYDSPSAFAAAFRAAFGNSPREFKGTEQF
jgi:AraC-like DNA-binding protein/quercetin dioxygenase-like cupin family protein